MVMCLLKLYNRWIKPALNRLIWCSSTYSPATKEEILTTAQALLKRKHGETWSMDISWRMWANDITTKNSHAEIDEAVESSIGPPVQTKPPDTLMNAPTEKVNVNRMALHILQEVRQSLETLVKSINMYEELLKDDCAWLEETSASQTYAEAVSTQEDVDHQDQ